MTNATTPEFKVQLQTELLRVVCQGGYYNKFTLPNGTPVEGATESDVIQHLTSGRDFFAGRQFRFPGIGSGFRFSDAVEGAGFRIVQVRNYRNQPCTIVTI